MLKRRPIRMTVTELGTTLLPNHRVKPFYRLEGPVIRSDALPTLHERDEMPRKMNGLVGRLRAAVDLMSDVANKIERANPIDVSEVMESTAVAAVVLMDVSNACAEISDDIDARRSHSAA